MDFITVPPLSAFSRPDAQMKQNDQSPYIFQLLAALTNQASRAEAARQLARYLGADDLLIFLRDEEVGMLLPAPGFVQTLPGGWRNWRAFLRECQEKGSASARLPFPDADSLTTALGFADKSGTTLVLLGGKPCLEETARLMTLLPLLEAAFQREQVRLIAAAESEIARKSAMEAQALLLALNESQQKVRDELRERAHVEEALREQVRLAALQVEVGRILARGGTLQELLDGCVNALVGHLHVALAHIWTVDEAEQMLELQASAGIQLQTTDNYRCIKIGTLEVGRAAQERQPRHIHDVIGDPRIQSQEVLKQLGLKAFAIYPLLASEHLIGVMAFFGYQPFSEAELSVVQLLSSSIALGVERIHTEAALKASEERFRLLADQAPIIIWQSNVQGDNIYLNATGCTFVGHPFGEPVGPNWLSLIHPDDRQASILLWREALEMHIPLTMEYRLHRADGVYREVMGYGLPYYDKNGRFMGYIGTLLDVTDQKEMQRQREAFVNMTAHELKTPLTAMQGNVQLTERRLRRLRGQIDPQQSIQLKQIDEIQGSLARSEDQMRLLNRLVNDMLDISRLQSNTLALHPKPYELGKLVREMVQDQQNSSPQRKFTLDLPEQQVMVHIDRDRIGQVIGNYLTNAVKYAPEDKAINVGLSLHGETARVWVADQGPGLTIDQQEHIWELYYRVPGMSLRPGMGISLGLGLHICRRLIERHQGRVGVESAPGQGARFWFTLPLPGEQE